MAAVLDGIDRLGLDRFEPQAVDAEAGVDGVDLQQQCGRMRSGWLAGRARPTSARLT